MSAAQRQAATQQHALAIAAINEMFDHVDELTAARDRLTGVAPFDPRDDPIGERCELTEPYRMGLVVTRTDVVDRRGGNRERAGSRP